MPSTRSSAATKCISDVPGLEKQTSTPPPTSVRTRLSAPFIVTPFEFSGIPIRANGPAYPRKRPLFELRHQHARRIDRTLQRHLTFRHALEAGLLVIRLIADQHDELMAFFLRVLERARHQHLPDAALAERRLDGERPQQERRRVTDANRSQPDRADHQRADARGK